MCKRLWPLVLTALLLGVAPCTVSASTVVVRSAPGIDQFDYLFFTYSGGALDIDILARDFDFDGAGGNIGIDDSQIALFADDGSPVGALTGALLGFNDDSLGPGFGDGSISIRDSFLSFPSLLAGNYVLAVGHFGFTEASARANGSSGLHAVFDVPALDYQATFSQDVQLPGVAPVPEPTSMILLGTGLVGMAGRRWRQRKAS